MADVRNLLRAEQASRRITHSNASYTPAGKLLCNICNIQLKADTLWDYHVRSKDHIKKTQEGRQQKPAQPPPATASRKRKADDEEDEEDEGRKRAKSDGLHGFVPEGFFDGGTDVPKESAPAETEDEEITVEPPPTIDELDPASEGPEAPVEAHPPAQQPNEDIDEDEWAAFERDVATPPPDTISADVINAGATIEAAPMSAADLAAQAREEQSNQRGRRDAELEAEKEEAEQRMMDEFEEMEGLEARVRKLREKREALRKSGQTDPVEAAEKEQVVPPDDPGEESDVEDESEDDEEWDGWHIKAG